MPTTAPPLPLLPAHADHALYSVAQTRQVEAAELATQPAVPLMQRAGAAIARLALAVAPHARRVWIAAGPGNNGGDGLEAAVHLKRCGRQVEVALQPGTQTPPDAQGALQRAQAAGVSIRLGAVAPQGLGGLDTTDLAIDALLGIGGSRAPSGALAEAIARLNTLRCPVLAADVPSGLDADTGRPYGGDDAACVLAQHTLTLLTAKPGLFTASGRDHAGRVWLDTLGVDLDAHASAIGAPAAWLRGLAARVPHAVRRHAQHKGSFGDVAVVGGSPGMAGAALLAARAAHAAGAGRVYVELLADAGSAAPLALDTSRPELMFRNDWTAAAASAALARTTVVCGCGGGSAVRMPLPRLLSRAG
ncbi:MAG TPA: NAD(P)H-hydrate epimerase, partial [Burkholderiaceae bacterium]